MILYFFEKVIFEQLLFILSENTVRKKIVVTKSSRESRN